MQFNLEQSIDVLRRTPDTILTMLSGLDEAWAGGREGPDTFSPFDVVGHLIDGEETDWIPRARLIRADGPPFVPFDRYRHISRNAHRSLDSLLDEFAKLRAANITELQSWKLTEKDLDLTGVHPALGTVTLRQLLATWVVHDLSHIAQIVRVMAKQYGTEVGPWQPFVPMLKDRT